MDVIIMLGWKVTENYNINIFYAFIPRNQRQWCLSVFLSTCSLDQQSKPLVPPPTLLPLLILSMPSSQSLFLQALVPLLESQLLPKASPSTNNIHFSKTPSISSSLIIRCLFGVRSLLLILQTLL